MLRFVSLAALVAASPAFAGSAYKDCAVPGAPAHVWHVDQARGSTPDAAHGGVPVGGVIGTADGSLEHPYNSLDGVVVGYPKKIAGYAYPLLSTISYDHYPKTGIHGQRVDSDWDPSNPNANRVNPGDQVVVHPGDYGDVVPTAVNGINNVDKDGATAFVQFVGAVGEDPPLARTLALSGRGFLFDGWRFVSTKKNGAWNSGALVRITNARDVFVQDSFVGNSVTDPGWTQGPSSDPNSWAANEKLGVGVTGNPNSPHDLSCVTVQNNDLRWLGGGLGVSAAFETTVTDNSISRFGGDAIDNYSNSDATFARNQITNSFDDGTGVHPDAIQFAFVNTHGTFRNVVVQDNYLNAWTDPGLKYARAFQGIYASNEAWDNLTITGNVVITSACWALSFGSLTNGLVANNTVVNDGISSACTPRLLVSAPQGAKDSNNRVINNVVSGTVNRYSCDDGATWADNIALDKIAAGVTKRVPSNACKNGVFVEYAGAGDYDGVKIIGGVSPSAAFQKYDPPANGLNPAPLIDLRPAQGGMLAGTSASIGALRGHDGLKLMSSDIGAYATPKQ